MRKEKRVGTDPLGVRGHGSTRDRYYFYYMNIQYYK